MHTLKGHNIFDASVVQDKKPRPRLTADSAEPQTAENSSPNREKDHGTETRRTVQTTGRVLPHIKEGILNKAVVNGWTESKALANLVEIGLEHDLGEQLWVRIAAKIDEAVYRAVEKYCHPLRNLAVKQFLAAEQDRIISIQTLRYILTLWEEGSGDMPKIIQDSQALAWESLKKNLYEEQHS